MWRLTRKELRGILRDRRTIVTLVLMPLLLYPLLSIGFQQFFLSKLGTARQPAYRMGFHDLRDGEFLSSYLARGGLNLKMKDDRPVGFMPAEANENPLFTAFLTPQLEAAVREGDVDIAVRVLNFPANLNAGHNLAVDCEIVFDEDSISSRAAAAQLEDYFTAANERFLETRLEAMGSSQRARAVHAVRKGVSSATTSGDAAGGVVSIAAVIPFILILMTITGAVYPAIDLTAGERERGTLEILVAAPFPRVGLLFAKYVAVLAVALLTATANLLTMWLTLHASGVGRLLFGADGLSAGVASAVFCLLVLFAAFFSAVLLVLTSFARSFREAQAYLIPLMLVSLGPGMLSLTPGLELKGLLLVTPLANITLLGRDLLQLKATGAAATVVVVSNMLYALAAIAVAARLFGSESVLYGNEYGWSGLFDRPTRTRQAPTMTNALFSLAFVFSAYFLVNSELAQWGGASIAMRLGLAAAASVVVFGGLPALAGRLGGVPLRCAFSLRHAGLRAYAGAVLLGVSLWPFAHEIVVLERQAGLVTFDATFLERAMKIIAELQSAPLWVLLVGLAAAPAICEEWFFRGYLFGALEAGANRRTAIVGSAIVFGLFHFIVTDGLAFERLIPSTLLGLALGWVRGQTASILPGVVLHGCHNGLLLTAAHYQVQLAAHGMGIDEGEHLAANWLAAAALAAVVGVLLVRWSATNLEHTDNPREVL